MPRSRPAQAGRRSPPPCAARSASFEPRAPGGGPGWALRARATTAFHGSWHHRRLPGRELLAHHPASVLWSARSDRRIDHQRTRRPPLPPAPDSTRPARWPRTRCRDHGFSAGSALEAEADWLAAAPRSPSSTAPRPAAPPPSSQTPLHQPTGPTGSTQPRRTTTMTMTNDGVRNGVDTTTLFATLNAGRSTRGGPVPVPRQQHLARAPTAGARSRVTSGSARSAATWATADVDHPTVPRRTDQARPPSSGCCTPSPAASPRASPTSPPPAASS
jgi:hypothetical protein